MKVYALTQQTIQYVIFEDTEYDYRRLGPGDWEVRMGESWESVYPPQSTELESSFDEYCINIAFP